MIKPHVIALLSTLVLLTVILCLHQFNYQLSTSFVPCCDTNSRAWNHLLKAIHYDAWKHDRVTITKPAITTNCSALVEGNEHAITLAGLYIKNWSNAETEEEFARKINNCTYIREEFGNLFYVSEEELEFPLAFTFVIHDRPKQIYRLLKAIYRPHNVYCIHTDGKQNAGFINIFLSISQCLDNVLVSSHLKRVFWGHHSLMDAQLNCAEDLMQYQLTRWKYVINICGFELPLRTNREIVQALKKLNGTSAVNSYPIPDAQYRHRFTYKYRLGYSHRRRGKKKNSPVPHNITIYKSLTQVALTHDFVHFLFTNKKAIDFRDYLKDIYIPEEEYYASLYRLPEAPGGFALIHEGTKVPIVDQCIWMYSKDAKQHPHNYCSGAVIRGVCILTYADLSRVYKHGLNDQFSMFFNKFNLEHDHIVMDCMEERLVLQNKKEFAIDHNNVLHDGTFSYCAYCH